MNPAALVRFLQGRRERLGRLVGKIEGMICQQAEAAETDPRICSRWRIRIRMNVHPDLFQETGLFQRLPAAQHGVADDGVVFAQKPG